MKLAIIGSGMIANEFLSIYHNIDGIHIKSIYGRVSSKEKLNRIKDTYNIENVFYDYNELLKSDIDTVYIALPNNLHYKFTKEALQANKNVIVEKPITTNYKEALELSKLAKDRNLFIFEAITTQYLPNYKKIKDIVSKLGDIKIVQCNFSQYSSRYDSFKQGNIQPAFDVNCSGGALMDLNIYNVHYVVGLFGKPKNVEYYPNIERNIDTSGILILEYKNFKCVCIGAKDCNSPISNTIQGNNGCIYQSTPTNSCEGFELITNDGAKTIFNENKYDHRMINEFIEFKKIIENNDFEACYNMLEHSLAVIDVLTTARIKSGIIFEADNVK